MEPPATQPRPQTIMTARRTTLTLTFAALLLAPLAALTAVESRPPIQSKLTSGVTFRSSDAGLQRLYDAAESGLARNITVVGGMRLITEGGGYAGAYLESAPKGGEIYATRDPQIALNHQLAFVLYPRADGRMPAAVFSAGHARRTKNDQKPAEGMIWHPEPGILGSHQSLAHDWDLPETAWKTYFWIGRDRDYLQRLYSAVEAYDAHLWRTRDSNRDGLLEVWCTFDTGEDASLRYGERNAPTRWPFDLPPGARGTPDPQHPASFQSYWVELFKDKRPAPRPEELRVPFASMDLMAWSYDGRIALSKIARELGNGREDHWRQKAQEVRQKVIKSLWVPERHACFDRDREGNILPELIHNNLRAMHHGLFTQEMADAFIREHLLNPQEFWTYAPLPSIAINEALFRNVPGNDWSGQPQGLTYQRAIRALENYGHQAEVSLIGGRLLHILQKNGTGFPQQLDPFTGAGPASKHGDYSPMMFAVLEYVSRLHGIHVDVEGDRVWWSALGESKDFTYTQRWGERIWTLVCEKRQLRASLNGRELFSCTAGARLVTDKDGKVCEVVGISAEQRGITLRSGTRQWQLNVLPNQVWGFDGATPGLLRATPFDHPFRQGAR